MRLYEFDKPRLVCAKLKEIVAFGNLDHLSEYLGPLSVDLVFFLQKLLLARGIKALVLSLVYLSAVVEVLEYFFYDFFMALLGSSYVVVVGDV